MVCTPLAMSAKLIFHQKVTLDHRDEKRSGLFEMVVYQVPRSKDYP